MSSDRSVIPKRSQPSPTLAMASLFEFLMGEPHWVDGVPYAAYCPPGNDSAVLFDVTSEYPESAVNFAANRGRVVLTAASTRFADLGLVMRSQVTASAYAHARPDSGFLAEHIHDRLRSWTRDHSRGNCIQQLAQFNMGSTTYENDSSLHRTSLMFTLYAG